MGDKIRVLYVDDEPILLEMTRYFLELDGAFAVDTLTSAMPALSRLETEQYDAIISDYQMPEIDGIGFLKQLKASGNTTPFIIFTGRGREEVVIEALNEGADFYLQKGGEPKAQFAELANKIRYAVSRRRAELDLRESEERYRHVVEDQTELICRFLPDGTHVFVNEAYCRYFGLDREEIIGTRFHPTIYPGDRADVARLMASLGPEHPFETIDQRIIMPDGSLRWQRWVDRAIFHADGSVKEYQSVGRDITDWKQAEGLLRESEAKYRTVFETTGTATVLIENDATISLANSEFERLSGFSKDEIENRKKWTEFVVKEDLDWMMGQHRLRRQDRKSARSHYEFRFLSRSGEIRHIFLTIDVIPGTTQSIASLLDISGRKRAEEDLIAAYQEYQALLGQIQDVYYRSDEEGRLVRISRSMVDMLGYEGIQELIGRNIAEECYLNPPDRKKFLEEIIRNGKVTNYELQLKKKDGTPVLISASSHLWYNPDGTIGGVEGIFRDITARKRADEALRESERKFRDFFNNAGDAITIHDMQGRFLEVNDVICRRLGFSREELLGMSPGDIDDPEYGKLVAARIQELRQTGHIVFETVHLTKDRTRIPTEVSSRVITYDGKPAVISTGRDITDRKRVEEALRQANKKLNLLSGITRHDIRNQLFALDGFVGLLHSELSDPSFEPHFSHIRKASSQIEGMIRFTREYEQIGVNAPVWQDLFTLVNAAGGSAAPGQVTLKNDLPENTEVFADPLILKVFCNLVDNAVRYGGTITTIRFSFVTHDGEGIIVCEDDGAGIPAEEKEMIFKRGFGKNTGLGLALSREILDITGITITETGEPGKGARFEMVVPKGMYRVRGT